MTIYAYIKMYLPVLLSPRFWGITGTAFFVLARAKGWIDNDWATFLQTVFGFSTVVGTANWAIKKVKNGAS